MCIHTGKSFGTVRLSCKVMYEKNRIEKCQAAESVSHGGMKSLKRECKGLFPQQPSLFY